MTASRSLNATNSQAGTKGNKSARRSVNPKHPNKAQNRRQNKKEEEQK
jgi:hypothetical protein